MAIQVPLIETALRPLRCGSPLRETHTPSPPSSEAPDRLLDEVPERLTSDSDLPRLSLEADRGDAVEEEDSPVVPVRGPRVIPGSGTPRALSGGLATDLPPLNSSVKFFVTVSTATNLHPFSISFSLIIPIAPACCLVSSARMQYTSGGTTFAAFQYPLLSQNRRQPFRPELALGVDVGAAEPRRGCRERAWDRQSVSSRSCRPQDLDHLPGPEARSQYPV